MAAGRKGAGARALRGAKLPPAEIRTFRRHRDEPPTLYWVFGPLNGERPLPAEINFPMSVLATVCPLSRSFRPASPAARFLLLAQPALPVSTGADPG